jgi:CDP-diacylglycerol---serine O-phosphatidyltransferase
MRRRDRQAYILILPSLFTTGNLFCGFYAIVRSMNHDVLYAAYAVLLAGVFDVLDGRVARMTGSVSKFGVEYDSIADVVSFGVAPALMLYSWQLSGFGRIGWAAAFFFAACGALRLARFNTIADDAPKSYFLGLPIPAAANTVAGVIIAYHDTPFSFARALALPLAFGLGLLMVSNIRYRSFKDIDVRHRRSFFWVVLLVAGLAFFAVKPEIALAVIFGYYAVWGPLREGLSALKRLTTRRPHAVVEPAGADKDRKGGFPSGGRT